MIKQLGTLTMIGGLAILAWLAFGHLETAKKQEQLLQTFQTIQAAAGEQEKPSKEPEERNENFDDGVVGILNIPVIELSYPVLNGASAEQLDVSLGAIEGLDSPSEIGGSHAIAGHQSYVFGNYFNRLHELKKGDQISYRTREGTLSYEVFDTQIVKPEQVEVLKRQDGVTLLSLITCYPERSNKYRLVVQAKRIN